MAYATRQRYIDISKFEPYKEEENRSVRLGNGANTSIKTQVDILDEPKSITYVTIDGTRWFVTDYLYLNGKQVQLNLQRDVVGEFGLGTSYGKIERGYTNGILKYRKELSLNEVLKKRVPLKSSSDTYGNLRVDNHNGEMWGILYFTKDSTKDKISINIPAFTPGYDTGTPPQIDVEYRNGEIVQNIYLSADIVIRSTNSSPRSTGIRFTYRAVFDSSGNLSTSIDYDVSTTATKKPFFTVLTDYWSGSFETFADEAARMVLSIVKQYLDLNYANGGFTLPNIKGITELDIAPPNVDGRVYQERVEGGYKLYEYNLSEDTKAEYGTYNFDTFVRGLKEFLEHQTSKQSTIAGSDSLYDENGYHDASSKVETKVAVYSRREFIGSGVGRLEISMEQQLVDEPYCILVCPLYNVKATIGNVPFQIEKKLAFNIFNEVIQYLSGENGFLVDAQIYPYCPIIEKMQTSIKVQASTGEAVDTFPFFSVQSTSFETPVVVQPRPYLDVKKDYITRSYSIVSPDQSSKFTFNFYDYVNDFVAEGDKNAVNMNIIIKTALKPFSIISSAVIERVNSLKGLNYDSNLEGSQSASGGFECSLSSNAFETYKRQNSNYQQLFDIDRTELIKNQEVERVNEATQFAMNMLTGTAFGAITGASIGDLGIGKLFGTKGAGAAVGATASALTIGIAGGIQLAKNEDLREYEREVQQQRFDLTIGTIKNLPNSVNRISSFNEIIMKDFYYVLEIYECTNDEIQVAENFINNYGYGIGVYDFIANYKKDGWFLKAFVTKSELPITLHQVLKTDIEGGVYINE